MTITESALPTQNFAVEQQAVVAAPPADITSIMGLKQINVQQPPEPAILQEMRKGATIEQYLNPVDICKLLNYLGYCNYPDQGGSLTVKLEGYIVEKLDLLKLKEQFESYILQQNFVQPINHKIFREIKNFFKAPNLTSLPKLEGLFLKDSRDACYTFYQNCYLRITPFHINKNSYDNLDRYVWKDDIIDRDFEFDLSWRDGIYCRFTHNQCRNPQKLDANNQPMFDKKRHDAYMCSIGYNMHSYKSRLQPCLTIYSDVYDRDRDRGGGGDGKSMIIQALQAMKPSAMKHNRIVVEPGESLRADYNHNFDNVTRRTNTVILEDLNTAKFAMENIYSCVTVGMRINRKNKPSEFLEYKDAPKFIITSNNPVSGTKDSDKRRRMDIQLHRYYHIDHKPFEDFPKGFFDEGFDAQDWKQFDNFALHCIQLSLKHNVAEKGLPAYENNVYESALTQEIGWELVEYLDELTEPMASSGLIKKLDSKLTYAVYKTKNPACRLSQTEFNKRLRKYAELKNYEVEIKPSGGVNWCIYTLTEECVVPETTPDMELEQEAEQSKIPDMASCVVSQ